jgi:hypothetical protein
MSAPLRRDERIDTDRTPRYARDYIRQLENLVESLRTAARIRDGEVEDSNLTLEPDTDRAVKLGRDLTVEYALGDHREIEVRFLDGQLHISVTGGWIATRPWASNVIIVQAVDR